MDLQQLLNGSMGSNLQMFQNSMKERIVESFNELCAEFLTKLSMIFKMHRVSIQNALQKHQIAIETGHEMEPMLHFYNSISEHLSLIRDRDFTFFTQHTDAMGGVNITELWHKTKPNTKNAIWNYLQKLTSFACEYEALVNPPTSGFGAGVTSGIDEKTLNQVMQNAMLNVQEFTAANGDDVEITPEILLQLVQKTHDQSTSNK